MKKLNKVASLFAAAALCASASTAFAQTAQRAVDNWRANDGTVWKNGTNQYCWRDNSCQSRRSAACSTRRARCMWSRKATLSSNVT